MLEQDERAQASESSFGLLRLDDNHYHGVAWVFVLDSDD